jgi:glycosyltransferase involved in cell wall biosynthesis
VDRVIAVSRFIASKVRELGYEGRVEVIPTGVRTESFPFRPRGVSPQRPRLLFVGRLIPYKGLDVLLRSLPAVDAALGGVTLEVIGDGPGRQSSEALARDLGVSRAVIFRGAQARPKVIRALGEADLVVVPSRTVATGQAEGLCNVTKEAMAAGVPVVATRNGGIPEAIPPRLQHELVPEDDPAALRDRIVELARSGQDWKERARYCREWLRRTLDWSVVGPRIADVYQEVVAAQEAGVPPREGEDGR